ncbi:MAG: peptide ABC transporter substrate-binding protein [Bdellovibrionaceae bacterium]|nr:peptide ABC transporter substrate-binding protein [Pseudobdellovibrionaceae bacterium]
MVKINTSILSVCLIFSFIQPVFAQKNKELTIGINTEYDSLNPILTSVSAAKYMLYLVSRPWAYMDDKNEWQPGIFKKIPNLKDKSMKIVTENGQKKLIATWEYIDGIKWGDGVPMSCKDAKFTWEVGLSPNTSLPSKEGYENVESITWDEKTPTKCVIKYKYAKWNFYTDSHTLMLPAHIEEPIFQKWGKEKEGYDRNTLYQKDPTVKGLWNGPYVVSEVKLGSHVVFTANPNFFGAKPKIQKIVIRIIPNSGTLEANLRSKTIDKIGRIGMSLDQALAFEKKVKEENLPYKVEFQDGITYAHIDVNLNHPILSDLKVREALSYAINKDDINKSIFDGKVTIAHSMTSPLDSLYTNDSKIVKVYKNDKKTARKILDEAGWKVGPDGFRYKNNQKLTFKLVGAAGIKQIETLQAILQSQWKDVGVDLQLKSDPTRLLFSETLRKRNFDLAVFSWSSFPGLGHESVLHSKNIPSEKNSWTGQNYPGFADPKVDKLTMDYDYEFDFKKRKKITEEIMKEYTTKIPVIPLYFRSEVAVIPKGLKNFRMYGHYFYETLQAENWNLE